MIEKFYPIFSRFGDTKNPIHTPFRPRLGADLDKYMENEAEIFIFPQTVGLLEDKSGPTKI